MIDKCSQKKQICRAKHNSDAALTLHPLRFRKEVVYFCSQNERQKMSHKSIVGMKDKRFRNPFKDPTTLDTFRTLCQFSQKKPSSASIKDDKDDKYVLFVVKRLQDLYFIKSKSLPVAARVVLLLIWCTKAYSVHLKQVHNVRSGQ